ncbi:conserved hypothetical protein [Streptomyces viridochromogenes DSM 40736]|uniref:Uncharacterized protein n=1 Tax=Streptomyces viridochromogenes (strain DSM 40736 / JCM 4977 / BCRC 1201 / Tue 494) TaxID=591159 RepID=D9XFR8_STRVT|nr:conserved hypothetical protein [Streptomyces viridochromogenes DSM 40736]
MGGVADGARRSRWVRRCLGRRGHVSSTVATSCDYGILPFGLRHSGGQPCQNRITGDPRTAPLRYITAGPSIGMLPSGRKIFGESRDFGTQAEDFAAT